MPGFTQYNVRVRQPGGFYLPNAPARGQVHHAITAGASSPCTRFRTHELGAGQLLLTTIRSHDQFNTTIYGENDRYRGISTGGGWSSSTQDDIDAR